MNQGKSWKMEKKKIHSNMPFAFEILEIFCQIEGGSDGMVNIVIQNGNSC